MRRGFSVERYTLTSQRGGITLDMLIGLNAEIMRRVQLDQILDKGIMWEELLSTIQMFCWHFNRF